MIPFKALACDFDGTLAVEDRVEPEVKGSLEQARRMGVRLILVTGRTFFELTRVCDCLELFDAVVAENGSVIYHFGDPPTSETRRPSFGRPRPRVRSKRDDVQRRAPVDGPRSPLE